MDAERAAEIAEDMVGRGFEATAIAEELSSAADAEKYGWIGVKYAGLTAGIVPDTELDNALMTLDNVYELLDPNRKTVSMAKLREALGEDG